jgi:hypothetical protein
MTYQVGDTYRYIDSMKGGLPHYIDTKIRTIHPPAGDLPGKLFLENDKIVELVQVVISRRSN